MLIDGRTGVLRLGEVKHVVSDILVGQPVARLVSTAQEAPSGTVIGANRARAVPGELQLLLRALQGRFDSVLHDQSPS